MRSTMLLTFLFYVAINNAFAESCWHPAENRYGIHEIILHAIALTESAMDSLLIKHNVNGSVDAGLINTSEESVHLVNIESDLFESIEMHEMIIVDGLMIMRQLNELLVPANSRVKLTAGGKHLMLKGAQCIATY